MPAKKEKHYSKREVAAIASEIRERYFKSDNPREGFLSLLDNLNGRIEVECGMPDETLLIKDDASFIVNIPENTSTVRDIFTIAHELGHYFLHTDLDRPGEVAFNRRGNDRTEIEANWFAAELLMPKDKFIEESKKFNCDPQKVASHFGVSGAAARVRMSVLGLI